MVDFPFKSYKSYSVSMKVPPNGFLATAGEGEDFRLIVFFFFPAFVSHTCFAFPTLTYSSQVS